MALRRINRGQASVGRHHVAVLGNERAAVFRDDEDREKYLERLAGRRTFPAPRGFQKEGEKKCLVNAMLFRGPT